MVRFDNMSSVYKNAHMNFSRGNYVEAKSLFKILVNDVSYRKNAYYMLSMIDIKENLYRKVREELKENSCISDIDKVRLLATLEVCEYNYGRSLELFDYLVKRLDVSYLGRGCVYAFLGEFAKSKGDFENVFSGNLRVQALLNLTSLYVFYGYYDKALDILSKIDKKSLSKRYYQRYEKIKILILYHQGKDPRSFNVLNSSKNVIDVLLEKDNSILTRKSGTLNFDNVHLKELILEAHKLISEVNRNGLGYIESYRGLLDENSSIKKPLFNGISVSVLTNTNFINAIMPADFSDEFDQERLSTDKSLRKRLNVK